MVNHLGSPFEAKVISPGKLKDAGIGFETFLDIYKKLSLKLNERFSFEIDTSQAGPGMFLVHLFYPNYYLIIEYKIVNYVEYVVYPGGEHPALAWIRKLTFS